jgi:hypothetical protein
MRGKGGQKYRDVIYGRPLLDERERQNPFHPFARSLKDFAFVKRCQKSLNDFTLILATTIESVLPFCEF